MVSKPVASCLQGSCSDHFAIWSNDEIWQMTNSLQDQITTRHKEKNENEYHQAYLPICVHLVYIFLRDRSYKKLSYWNN